VIEKEIFVTFRESLGLLSQATKYIVLLSCAMMQALVESRQHGQV
jgi:hypothetical protein